MNKSLDELYQSARQDRNPRESMYSVLDQVEKEHKTIKNLDFRSRELMMSSLRQSCNIIQYCIDDIDSYTKSGFKTALIDFVRGNLLRARAHLSYYIGESLAEHFVEDYKKYKSFDAI